jgi:hypothetical protein
MAINKKDVTKKISDFNKQPLTEKELKAISIMESLIDSKIIESVDKYKKTPVKIELGYPTFVYNVDGIEITSDMRVRMMADYIKKLYQKAGWKITVEYDDGLDGPNMSGPDYWVLS